MSATHHIASVLITAEPSQMLNVKKKISALEFASIAASNPDGKLIVTIKSPTEVALVQGLTDLQLLPGVASASLCAHRTEKSESAP